MKSEEKIGMQVNKNPILNNNVLKNGIALVACIFLPLMVGAISGFFTSKNITTWYAFLNKPFFNPPNYLFAPVWTVLYLLMGISFYRIIRKGEKLIFLVSIFVLQLTLNFFWSFIFFNLQQIGMALIEIVLLWVSIFSMIILFYKHDKWAALLTIPYILWVSFALILNAALYKLN